MNINLNEILKHYQKIAVKKMRKNKILIFCIIEKWVKRHKTLPMLKLIRKKNQTFKQLITLNLLDIDNIVISDKIKHNIKWIFIIFQYLEDNIITRLCIIFPHISRYINYFDDGGKKCVPYN